MEILLLSTLHENAAGILKITPQEIAVYDPITGKKKSRAVGVTYTDDMIIPNQTSSERLASILPPGKTVYDTTDGKVYVGDGQTPGGNPLFDDSIVGRIESLEGINDFVDSAMAIICVSGGEFEPSAMAIIGEA